MNTDEAIAVLKVRRVRATESYAGLVKKKDGWHAKSWPAGEVLTLAIADAAEEVAALEMAIEALVAQNVIAQLLK